MREIKPLIAGPDSKENETWAHLNDLWKNVLKNESAII
jgi:hypothetical protein